MKAIILAAGQGTRLKKYTENLPKGMLEFAGKTLIERDIETFRECGINNISIVRGFAADKINYEGVKYYTNKDYSSTNMVESFLCAKQEFDDDIIVSYSDILFESRLLEGMINTPADHLVAVDTSWKDYWMMRYGRIDFDTESLSIDKDGNITELGLNDPDVNAIDARYIGLLKFSRYALSYIRELIQHAAREYGDRPWQQSGNPVRKAYMTDLLNALIESGKNVKALCFQHGWIEFDTNEDYENAIMWMKNGSLSTIMDLKE